MEYSTFQMENQMETGTKKMVKKEEDNDRFSTVANAGDRKKPLEKVKRRIGSTFRSSVKVEMSPAEVENTECGQLAKPVNQESSQPASSSNVMKKEETSDNWSTMVLPEMPLSTSRKSSTERTSTKKMQETRSSQPSKTLKFVNGALVDTSVSLATSADPDVPGTTFIYTSPLKAGNKAKRPATIESGPIKVNSIGASSPDNGRNKDSNLESGSGDHNDGDSDVDDDISEAGLSNQRHLEANTNNTTDDCDEGQFTCLDCAATFETDAAFKKHIASHEGYRRHKCTVCEKRFMTKRNLMVHMRRHTGERPFGCDICDKKFTTNSELTAHKRIHTGCKPFECLICHKRFTHSGHLLEHKLIHTGERPFKCNICDKKFATSGNLVKHKRIHTGEQPFKCDVCKKGFTESGSLRKHKRIHTGEKPYTCLSCGLCFRYNCTLKIHQCTQHSDPDADTQPDVSHLQHLLSFSLQADASPESSPMEDSTITEKV